MNTQYRKNLKAVLEASKSYCDESIANLEWQIGTYDYDVATDSNVARLKVIPENTYKSQVDYIGGKTVKYNQLVNPLLSFSKNDINMIYNTTKNKYVVNGTASASTYVWLVSGLNTYVTLVVGHKYIFITDFTTTTGVNMADMWNSQYNYNRDGTNKFIFTASQIQFQIALNITNGTTLNNFECYVELIDLTDIFGAGNEPSTVETAIPLLKANGYKLDGTDTYSTGSLKHAIVSGVEYESKNLFDYGAFTTLGSNYYVEVIGGKTLYRDSEVGNITRWSVYDSNKNLIENMPSTFTASGTYTLPTNAKYINPNNDTPTSQMCIGYDISCRTYIPYVAPITKAIPSQALADARYGLGFDNTNYNHLDIDGHLRGNWGIVDLGTLTWQYSSSWRCFYTLGFTQAKRDSSSNQKNGKNYVGVAGHSSSDSFGDNTISINSSYHDDGYITIRDTSFNGNAQDFKTAMSGVYLLYELAEAFDQDYSQYFDTNWNKVDLDKQYATCEMVCDEPIDMPNSITNLIKEVKA